MINESYKDYTWGPPMTAKEINDRFFGGKEVAKPKDPSKVKWPRELRELCPANAKGMPAGQSASQSEANCKTATRLASPTC